MLGFHSHLQSSFHWYLELPAHIILGHGDTARPWLGWPFAEDLRQLLFCQTLNAEYSMAENFQPGNESIIVVSDASMQHSENWISIIEDVLHVH